MKRRLTTMTLVLAIIFFSLSVYVEPAGNAKGATSAVSLLLLTGPVSIELEADPTSIPADGSSYTIITATFKDGDGYPIPAGTSVTFTTTLGTFPPNGQDYTLQTYDATGVVTVFLHAGFTAGTAWVTATLGSVSEQVPVTIYDSGAASVTVKAVPSTLTADGVSTSTITATVTDGGGGFVPDGTEVSFSADHGNFGGLGTTTATTISGIAGVTYTAPSSKPADGLDTVAATSDGASGGADITLTGPTLGTIVLSANPTVIPANGTSTSAITATVTVEGGSSAPAGVVVTFTIKSGDGTFAGGLTEIEKETNDSGIAVATLTSGTSAGTATIGASADGVTAQDVAVTYEPGSLTLTIVPNSVLATGEEEVQVTVLLKDADGNPVANETIDLTLSDATLGSFDDLHPLTDVNGEASSVFTSGDKGGTVTITATWHSGGTDVTGTGTITIQTPPAFILVAENFPEPTAISIRGTGGQSTSQIVFDVQDALGNLVVDGYRVDFSIQDGPNGGEEISPLFAATKDGKVSTILRSGFKSGPVSIKASYHSDTNISTVTGQIAIVAGPPVGEEFGVSAQYVNISGFWKIGLRDRVTLSAGDIYGNAVPDNTAVSFKTYNTGGLFDPGSASSAGGVATNDLVSVSSPKPQQGFLSVTGEVINGGRTTHVTCLDVASDATNTIYAGTDGGGVYKSIDYGATWNNVSRSSTTAGQNWIDPYVNDLALDPDNGNTVYAATGYLGQGHLYRSLDGGANWNSNNVEEFAGVVTTESAVLSVLCDDNGSDYVWISTNGNGVLFSKDGENFEAGGDAIPTGDTQESVSGTFDNPANTGDGTMTKPTLSDIPRTESWDPDLRGAASVRNRSRSLPIQHGNRVHVHYCNGSVCDPDRKLDRDLCK